MRFRGLNFVAQCIETNTKLSAKNKLLSFLTDSAEKQKIKNKMIKYYNKGKSPKVIFLMLYSYKSLSGVHKIHATEKRKAADALKVLEWGPLENGYEIVQKEER